VDSVFFPPRSTPRVFWAGIEASPNLKLLAAEIENAMEKVGIPREQRPFSPHLTLGAFRASLACGTTSRGDSGTRSERIWPIATNQFHLIESKLKPSGAELHYGRKFFVRGGGGLSAHVLGVDTCHFSCHPFCRLSLGSIPFGLLLAKLFGGGDVRKAGSGNIGATNVARVVGPLAGVLTLTFDTAKVRPLVWLAGRFTSESATWMMVAAFAVLLGHCFPVGSSLRAAKVWPRRLECFSVCARWQRSVHSCCSILCVAYWRYVSLGSVARGRGHAAAHLFLVGAALCAANRCHGRDAGYRWASYLQAWTAICSGSSTGPSRAFLLARRKKLNDEDRHSRRGRMGYGAGDRPFAQP